MGMLTMKWRTLLLVLVVAAVVVVAGVSVYVLTRPPPPIPLTVSDGSTTGVIAADFANYVNSDAPLVLYFNATTYANQSGGPVSGLSLQLEASAGYLATARVVIIDVLARVQGKFAPGLRLSGLTVGFNQTGHGELWARPAPWWGPEAVNVTYVSSSRLGPSPVGATPVNQTGAGPSFEFMFPVEIQDFNPIGYNQFVGIRAVVEGRFAPAVSVGILLRVVDQPA